jgi:sterol desaturase/sphingolipid hydroxylase (fatty acid hydroxylase superfamily)
VAELEPVSIGLRAPPVGGRGHSVFLSALLSLGRILGTVRTFGLSIGTAGIVNWILSQYGWPRIALPADGILQLTAGFSIYYLAMTFFAYWGHRLMHAPWFWHLHRVHHAATELNMITVFRQHPVEPVVLNFLSIVSPAVFFDVPDQVLLIAFFWGTTFDLLAHSQLPWGYGWFGRSVVTSPRVHQIHHSTDDEHRDLHFSNCPLWDHLFGTWYSGAKLPSEYGIPDNQYESRPFRQFIYDPLAFYASVMRDFAHGATSADRRLGRARRFEGFPHGTDPSGSKIKRSCGLASLWRGRGRRCFSGRGAPRGRLPAALAALTLRDRSRIGAGNDVGDLPGQNFATGGTRVRMVGELVFGEAPEAVDDNGLC